MELLRVYLKQTKIFLIAFVFAVAASAAVVCLYQLPAEAVIYMAVLWLGAGAAAFGAAACGAGATSAFCRWCRSRCLALNFNCCKQYTL
mgnify:CR=1 FL=1